MNNVLPMLQGIRNAQNEVRISPMLRPYIVTMTINSERHEINVLAFKSCDAICNVIDMYFDGEYEMPDSMSIKESPANVLRAA